MITVYCDGEMFKMTLAKLKNIGWNVLRNNSNGYSHDYTTVEAFDKKYIQMVGGNKTIWCTKNKLGRLMNSSEVTFS